MRIYHSAFTLKDEAVGILGGLQPRILRSFHGNKSTDRPEWCPGMFLDSGAFSAFKSGAVIDIQKYIAFLQENGGAFEAYAGLDVIGDAEASVANQKILDDAGLNALPTYHVNESYDLLRYYADKYDHIAFGGMVPHAGSTGLKNWLANAWGILAKYPDIKVHGFGLTDINLARQYPWYSIDSTTASRAGRTGVLVTPWGQLRVSRAITSKTSATIHTKYQIAKIMSWITEEMPDLNIDWQTLSEPSVKSSQLRIIINARYIEQAVQEPFNDLRKRKNITLI